MSDLAPSCPTGNCDFDTYWSLSVCTSYTNVTPHLYTKTPFDSRWYLTPEHFISTGNVYMNITSASRGVQDDDSSMQAVTFSDSIAYRDINPPIVDTLIIVTTESPEVSLEKSERQRNYVAYEVIMDWCVRSYNTSVTKGVASTIRLDSHGNFTQDPSYRVSPFNNNGQQRYDVGNDIHYGLQKYFQALLHGTISLEQVSLQQGWYASSESMPLLFEPFNVFQDEPAGGRTWNVSSNSGRGTNMTGFQLILDNIATSMTN